MTLQTIAQVADNDTPANVQVDPSVKGVVAWALGRFGGTALIAMVLLYGMRVVYTDMLTAIREDKDNGKVMSREFLDAYKEQTRVNAQMTAMMEKLAKKIDP